jgi:hypothetical protein
MTAFKLFYPHKALWGFFIQKTAKTVIASLRKQTKQSSKNGEAVKKVNQ